MGAEGVYFPLDAPAFFKAQCFPGRRPVGGGVHATYYTWEPEPKGSSLLETCGLGPVVKARADQKSGVHGTGSDLQVNELFRDHALALRRFIKRILREHDEADDVVQETFLRIWRKAQDGHLRTDSKAYLFQAALNVARDVLRHRRLEGAIFAWRDLSHNAADPGASVYRQVAGREAMEHLANSLGELPEFTRAVFLLHHIDQLSVPAIADYTGKTTRTVERHLARALSHCTQAMRPHLKDV